LNDGIVKCEEHTIKGRCRKKKWEKREKERREGRKGRASA
jgi:hypothetical protein